MTGVSAPVTGLTPGSAACLSCGWTVSGTGYAALLGEQHTAETSHPVVARYGGPRRYGPPPS